VLAVVLFVLFWLILGFSLFFVAVRGGPGGARETLQTQTRGGRRALEVIFVFIYVGFGIVIPTLILTGNHANANAQVGGLTLNASEQRGRELFGQACSQCHTLAAANTVGKTGPNLDQLQPPTSLVLNTIRNGCLQDPPPHSNQSCLGYGTMPADVVTGRDAQDVAAFVGRVAGKE
jgi:mono/diheme cytochrome c family protein